MNFVLDQLWNGKRFRAFTVPDMFSRESLAVCMAKSIKGEQVSKVLQKIKATRGLPLRIKVDNRPEFISRALDVWAYFNKAKLDYSRPGTPADTPHIESISSGFRDKCLNMNWFMFLMMPETK
jgi:putative transposase